MQTISPHSCLGRRLAMAALAAAMFIFMFVGPAMAVDPVNASWLGGVAIKGTDAVAYFTKGRAVEGTATHQFKWKGATWRFASAGNRDLFAGDPQRYAPQFGGYCAWAVSRGYTADIDPEAWKIVDGKLYLNYSKSVQAQWLEDMAGNIRKARENWPRLLSGN